MRQLTWHRRQLLALTGGALAAAATGLRAQAATAPLNFGYQTTSWGTIGMLVEAEGLFQKAGANVTVLITSPTSSRMRFTSAFSGVRR